MKRTTIDRYWKWKESAKSKDKFTTGGVSYKQSEFESLIGHKPAQAPEPEINTYEDITDEHYGDLEEQDSSTDTEES